MKIWELSGDTHIMGTKKHDIVQEAQSDALVGEDDGTTVDPIFDHGRFNSLICCRSGCTWSFQEI